MERYEGYTKAISAELCIKTLMKFNDYTVIHRPKNKTYHDIVSEVAELFPVKVSLSSYENVLARTDLTKSAGFSFPHNKKGEVIEDGLCMAKYIAHRVKYSLKTYAPPCKLGARGHLKPTDERKTRAVFIYPMEITLNEGIFGYGLIDHLKEFSDTIFFGQRILHRL